MDTQTVIIEGIEVDLPIYDAILAIQAGHAKEVYTPPINRLGPYGTVQTWLTSKTPISDMTYSPDGVLVSFTRGGEFVSLEYDTSGRLQFVRGLGWVRELVYSTDGSFLKEVTIEID